MQQAYNLAAEGEDGADGAGDDRVGRGHAAWECGAALGTEDDQIHGEFLGGVEDCLRGLTRGDHGLRFRRKIGVWRHDAEESCLYGFFVNIRILWKHVEQVEPGMFFAREAIAHGAAPRDSGEKSVG